MKGIAPTVIAAAAPLWPNTVGPTTSVAGPLSTGPLERGYSIASTSSEPFSRKATLSRGEAVPAKRLTTSWTVREVAEVLSHWKNSSGTWSPLMLRSAESAISPPLASSRKASRSVSTPSQGSFHCRSTDSVPPGAILIPSVLSVAVPGLKSMQASGWTAGKAWIAGGQLAESRYSFASQEPISWPLESSALSLPADEK